MTSLDWAVVALYCVGVLALGVWVERRGATKDTAGYFLSGRALPWWIAGASMAASAFSIDTPLYVAKRSQEFGIAGNWQWWFMGVSGVLGAVVLGRYWRRAGITTDLELITLRYSGRAAHVLRGFRALFFGLFLNALAIAVVIAAVIKVCGVILPGTVEGGVPTAQGALLIGGLVAVTVTYSVLSGFTGVVLTDLLQFAISMLGSLLLAGVVVYDVGGFGALASHPRVVDKLAFLPDFTVWTWDSMATELCVFMGVAWWTYVNADGGGKYVQRLAACRDEGEAEKAYWLSSITFIALRSWPWILIAFGGLVLLPAAADPENAYPRLAMGLAPGVRGFVVASLLAAFMSTIDTQLNWGASYLVNDLLKPYLLKGATERAYVRLGRLCALPMLLLVLLFLYLQMQPAGGEASRALVVTRALQNVLLVTSGLGAVYLLRWFWSGLSAWGEVAGMVAAPLTALVCNPKRLGLALDGFGLGYGYAQSTLAVTAVTVAAAIAVSLLGPREDEAHLRRFAARVRPAGLWGGLRPEGAKGGGGWLLLLRFLAGNAILYGLTFALGGLLLVKGAAVVLGNLALLVGGLLVDRWARGQLARDAEPAPVSVLEAEGGSGEPAEGAAPA